MKQKIYSAGLLLAAIVSAVLSSPKVGISFLAWVNPICLLAFYRLASVRRKAVWVFPALMLAHYLADLGVAPFPAPVLLVLCAFQSLQQLALYGADAWVSRRTDRFYATLFFPSFAVGLEFLNTIYGGGIWWSVANSQFRLSWLAQVASVTGIWGISFLLYWTASVLVWVVSQRTQGRWKVGLGVYGGVMAVVVLAGCVRYMGGGGRGQNEAVLVGPDGNVLTRFHKNNPVPMVEASQPGDGIIPVVQTPFGRLAVSICYDADQPEQMRQLGRQNADLLLLPSGDWYAISPFHTHMAVYRGIENGCSIFREVSNGLSIATDYRGRTIGSRDHFRDGASFWVADLPVGHVQTIYARIGDILAYSCLLYTLGTIVLLLVVRRRVSAAPFVTDQMALLP